MVHVEVLVEFKGHEDGTFVYIVCNNASDNVCNEYLLIVSTSLLKSIRVSNSL